MQDLLKYVEKRDFLSFSAASANEFYIIQQRTYIVCILQCQKNQKQLPSCLRRVETCIALIVVLWCPLCEVRDYAVVVSYRCSA